MRDRRDDPSSDNSKSIAIIGLGCRFPGAHNPDQLWDRIVEGKLCYQEIPNDRWNHALFFDPAPRAADATYARSAGMIEDVFDFDPSIFGISPRRATTIDPQQRLFLSGVQQALASAGYDRNTLPASETGVFSGVSVSEHKSLVTSRIRVKQALHGAFGQAQPDPESMFIRLIDRVPRMGPYSMVGQMHTMVACALSQSLGLGGPAFAVDSACASALVATAEAILHLRAGSCRVAIAGGVYLMMTPDNLVAFAKAGALSRRDLCSPFSSDADGFVLGEGVGVLLLKRLADAQNDGDPILAVIRGFGISNDGISDGPMTPNPAGQVLAMRRACSDARIDPSEVDCIECHGTGTVVGDRAEARSLRQVYGANQRESNPLYLGSVKANLGHTLSAAGAASLIKSVYMLQQGCIPPQINCDEIEPELRLEANGFAIPETARDWNRVPGRPRRIGVSAFGFGGTNVHMLLEEAGTTDSSSGEKRTPKPFAIETPAKEYRLVTPKTGISGTSAGGSASLPHRKTPVPEGQPPPELIAEIIHLVEEISGLPPGQVEASMKIQEDCGFDSLMVAEFGEALTRSLPLDGALDFDFSQYDPTIIEISQLLASQAADETRRSGRDLGTGGIAERTVDQAAYRFDLFPEYQDLCQRRAEASANGAGGLYFCQHTGRPDHRVHIDGREMVNFASYNYLGLAGDPEIAEAAKTATDHYGTSASASRILAGETPLHRELERQLAAFLGHQDVLVQVAGHATNVNTIGQLVGAQDLVVHDALAHNSILEGIRLSGASRRSFAHNDIASLEAVLEGCRTQFRRTLIIVEGLYSMDGDLCPLPELVEVKRRHHSLLFVDEAHSIGTVGATGRGVAEVFGISPSEIDICMGTLSKALASCGGFVAGTQALIDVLRYTNPGFLFSAGSPPATMAAALAALRRLDRDPSLVDQLRLNSEYFLSQLKKRGIETGLAGGTAIVPCLIGDSLLSMRLAERLHNRDIHVLPIVYPAVAEEQARLRFFVSAGHARDDLATSARILAEELERAGVRS